VVLEIRADPEAERRKIEQSTVRVSMVIRSCWSVRRRIRGAGHQATRKLER